MRVWHLSRWAAHEILSNAVLGLALQGLRRTTRALAWAGDKVLGGHVEVVKTRRRGQVTLRVVRGGRDE